MFDYVVRKDFMLILKTAFCLLVFLLVASCCRKVDSNQPIPAASYVPGGQVYYGNKRGEFSIADLKTGKTAPALNVSKDDPITCVATDTNAAYAVLGTAKGRLVLFSGDLGITKIAELKSSASMVSLSVTSKKQLVGYGTRDGVIALWNYADNLIIGSSKVSNSPIWAHAISADGNSLVVGTVEGEIMIIDCKTFRTHFSTKGGDEGVSAVAFSRDSSCVAVGGNKGSISLLDVATRSTRRKSETSGGYPIGSVTFAKDEKTLTATSAQNVYLMSAVTYEVSKAFSVREDEWLLHASIDTEMNKLVALCDSGAVYFLDMVSRTVERRLYVNFPSKESSR